MGPPHHHLALKALLQLNIVLGLWEEVDGVNVSKPRLPLVDQRLLQPLLPPSPRELLALLRLALARLPHPHQRKKKRRMTMDSRPFLRPGVVQAVASGGPGEAARR